MARVIDWLYQGGPVMWPLLGLSLATATIGLERMVFWLRFLSQEERIVHDVLSAPTKIAQWANVDTPPL